MLTYFQAVWAILAQFGPKAPKWSKVPACLFLVAYQLVHMHATFGDPLSERKLTCTASERGHPPCTTFPPVQGMRAPGVAPSGLPEMNLHPQRGDCGGGGGGGDNLPPLRGMVYPTAEKKPAGGRDLAPVKVDPCPCSHL